MDMADEQVKDIESRGGGKIPGIHVEKQRQVNIEITRVEILDEQGEQQLGKPKGNYITVDMKAVQHQGPEGSKQAAKCIASELNNLIKKHKRPETTLIVGLGNYNVTSDSMGPKTIQKILVTRHIKEFIDEELGNRMDTVCAISPGVLGTTGIETLEIIRGVAEKVKPDLIIAIDALASSESERVGTSIQMADTGISPGAGIGNKRMMLNEETIGVRTIGLGVPTVVYAQIIGRETLDVMKNEFSQKTKQGSSFFKMLNEMENDNFYLLTNEILNKHLGNMIVTPKDIDVIIDKISDITAKGINLAMQMNLEEWEIDGMMN